MKFFYDCEFLEDGYTIDLLSIGIVAADGREYYAVNKDPKVWRRVRYHTWLMDNVVPHLPKAYGDARNQMPSGWLFNYADPAVKGAHIIAREVEAFIGATGADRADHELWGYYPAYDHVALAHLWGPMINLPGCVPMRTRDIMDLVPADVYLPDHVPQHGDVHHALGDARWNRDAYNWIMKEKTA